VPDPPLHPILGALLDHGVDFVIIGATAAILQGVPIAATFDVDITAATSRKNLTRLTAALIELKAQLRVADGDEVSAPLDVSLLQRLSVLTLLTTYGPFDVLFTPLGSPSYERLKERSLELNRFGYSLRVATIEDLIAMKSASGREKDAAHLTALLAHLRSLGRRA
jgi:hypothetical protein